MRWEKRNKELQGKSNLSGGLLYYSHFTGTKWRLSEVK